MKLNLYETGPKGESYRKYTVLHETGHALYEQGLPKEHIGTARGNAAGMTDDRENFLIKTILEETYHAFRRKDI